MCDDNRAQRHYEALTEHLRLNHVAFGQMGDERTVQFFISARRATHLCLCSVAESLLKCYVTLGPHAPAERRVAVVELLNRINWKIAVGNFEMDPDDGEIRLRMFHDARFSELSEEAIEATIRISLNVVEHFYPAVMSVIWNDVTPEDALALIEPERE